MPSHSLLVKELKRDNPEVTFASGHDFMWSPDERTIHYGKLSTKNATASLLHETAHALLGHLSFDQDIELLAKEAEAWDYAKTILAPRYNVLISDAHVSEQLDSYRDWMHLRSLCPNCSQTGIQTKTNRYSCINCSGSWQVNDARRCRLRRIVLPIAV